MSSVRTLKMCDAAFHLALVMRSPRHGLSAEASGEHWQHEPQAASQLPADAAAQLGHVQLEGRHLAMRIGQTSPRDALHCRIGRLSCARQLAPHASSHEPMKVGGGGRRGGKGGGVGGRRSQRREEGRKRG